MTGVPTRNFNFQLVPNYAGPLDPRALGSSTDRPTTLLYEGLIRYETNSGTFVYVSKVNNNWVWKPLTFDRNILSVSDTKVDIYRDLIVNGTSSSVNVKGSVYVDGALRIKDVAENRYLQVTSNTLTVSAFGTLADNTPITANMFTNVTIGDVPKGTTVGTLCDNSSYNTVHKLLGKMLAIRSTTGNLTSEFVLKSGDVMQGDLTVPALYIGGTNQMDVKTTLANTASDVSGLLTRVSLLEQQLTDHETRVTVMHGTNLYQESDYRNLQGSGLPITFQFVYNPRQYTLGGSSNNVLTLPAGTYRFTFTAQSISPGVGYNDAFVCRLQVDGEDPVYAAGYNEWNGGGATSHQAVVHMDELYTKSGFFNSSIGVTALDGRITWCTFVVEKLA